MEERESTGLRRSCTCHHSSGWIRSTDSGSPSRGDRLVVSLASVESGKVVFDATLALHRRGLSRAALGRVLWRYPLLTLRISTGIYSQALRLWAKGSPFHAHPERRAPAAV
jgi:DUF1365 family protein